MSKRELTRTIIQCVALGIVLVALGCLALDWLRSDAAAWFWAFWG